MTKAQETTPNEYPPDTDRDLSLGQFMDSWSELEAMLRKLLAVLCQAPNEAAFSIAAAIPDFGRMRELLDALGELYLETDDLRELHKITNYLLISNKYRNSIVHGQWVLSLNREREVTDGIVYHYAWLRMYTMIDKSKEFNAVLGRDPKAQDQYVFTVKRLKERATKARDFAKRISEFSDRIQTRLRKGPADMLGPVGIS